MHTPPLKTPHPHVHGVLTCSGSGKGGVTLAPRSGRAQGDKLKETNGTQTLILADCHRLPCPSPFSKKARPRKRNWEIKSSYRCQMEGISCKAHPPVPYDFP